MEKLTGISVLNAKRNILNYRKLWCKIRPFKPENIFTKLAVDLYGRVKLQIFTIEWSTNGIELLTRNLPNRLGL